MGHALGLGHANFDGNLMAQQVNFFPSEKYSNIKITFNPDNRSNESPSSYGNGPLFLRIEVPNEAPVGQYTIPISLNILTESIGPETVHLGDLSIDAPIQGNITTLANLTLSVIKPPTIEEKIKEFWDVYGDIISLLGAGFAGALSTYIFDYLKNRKKADRDQKQQRLF
jgi:hypothetical protein